MLRGLLHIFLQPIGGIALSNGSPRAVRSIFSAITLARAPSIPSAEPSAAVSLGGALLLRTQSKGFEQPTPFRWSIAQPFDVDASR